MIILELALTKARFHDQNHEAEESAGEVFAGENAFPPDCEVHDRENQTPDLRSGRWVTGAGGGLDIWGAFLEMILFENILSLPFPSRAQPKY